MADSKNLNEQLSQLFASELYLEVASPEVDLLEAGVLDSALIVEILLLVDRHFGISIPVETLELDSIRSISSIAGLIAAQPDAA